MILTSLTLQNFRSYTKKSLTFSPAATLITGENAAGKTNILEAIMLLAAAKSFRTNQDRESIRWNSEIARITGCGDDTKLEIVFTTTSVKKYLVNGVSRRMIDFVGNLRAVLFWPEDLEIVTDSPSLRRKYLDTVLIQVDREYRRSLRSYERGLRQRNKLLDLIHEGKAARSQLLFWDQLLIRAGGFITEKRASYLAFVNATALREHRFGAMYDKSVISESRLLQYKDEEVAAKATLVGPHRDDFMIVQNDKNLSTFGSRGEQRVAVLWLKLAELAFIEQAAGSRPILLLDDIFSELDEEHRNLVADVVKRQQTIITSADIASTPKTIHDEARLIRL
jgi:DNA replication and repair protein RecF